MEEVANNTSQQALADYEASNSNRQELPNDIQPPAQPPFQPETERQPPLQPPPPVRNSRRNRPPRGRNAYQEPAGRHFLGQMNVSCPHCHALHFDVEKLSSSTRNAPKFGMCCLTGQISLPSFPPPPQELLHLFDGTSPNSPEFKTNIHQYNATFAFTSLGANINHSVLTGTLDHIHFGSVVSSIIMLLPSSLLPTVLLHLPSSISMIQINNCISEMGTTTKV